MMPGLYERLAATRGGARALASARLRRDVLAVLHKALGGAGLAQAELARRLKVRKSAVNQVLRGDGNVRVSTIAEYLDECGYELQLRLVRAGTSRKESLRAMELNWETSLARRVSEEWADYVKISTRAARSEKTVQVQASHTSGRQLHGGFRVIREQAPA